jgi:hypothetical protein
MKQKLNNHNYGKMEIKWIPSKLMLIFSLLVLVSACKPKDENNNPTTGPNPLVPYCGDIGCAGLATPLLYQVKSSNSQYGQALANSLSLVFDVYGSGAPDVEAPITTYTGKAVIRGYLDIATIDGMLCHAPVGRYELSSFDAFDAANAVLGAPTVAIPGAPSFQGVRLIAIGPNVQLELQFNRLNSSQTGWNSFQGIGNAIGYFNGNGGRLTRNNPNIRFTTWGQSVLRVSAVNGAPCGSIGVGVELF